MSAAPRDWRRLVALGPALLVSLTALSAQPGQAGGFRLTKWSVFGLGLGVLALALFARKGPLRVPTRWLALGAFVTATVALPVFSSVLAPAHWPNALGTLSGAALFFVTAIALGEDEDARRASLMVLVGGGMACSLLVLLQVAGLRWLTSEVYTGVEFRAPSTFGNPNWAAAYLAPLVPLALALASTAPVRSRWLWGAAGLLAVATLATLSKGGAVTLVAGVFFYAVLGRDVPRARRLPLLGAATALTVTALLVLWQQPLLTEVSWLRGRLFLWRAAWLIVGEHPLTGVGAGGYNAAYGQAAAALIGGKATAFMPLATVDFTHNDLLQLAAEGGFVSAVAFVAAVASALVVAHRRADPLSRAVGAALAALFVNGLADSPLRVPSTFVLVFFLWGWLAPTAPRDRRYRPLLLAIALLGAVQGIRFAAGNAAWTQGREALSTSSRAADAVASLAAARIWLPEHGRSAAQYAHALARAGRFDDALAASHIAASLRFDFDDEVFRRDLQSRSLPRDAAIREWQGFAAHFPALVTPQLRLAALYLRGGDRDAAIAAYEAVAANPQKTPRAEAARAQARKLLQALSATRRAPSSLRPD